jgi:hypothetical protein
VSTFRFSLGSGLSRFVADSLLTPRPGVGGGAGPRVLTVVPGTAPTARYFRLTAMTRDDGMNMQVNELAWYSPLGTRVIPAAYTHGSISATGSPTSWLHDGNLSIYQNPVYSWNNSTGAAGHLTTDFGSPQQINSVAMCCNANRVLQYFRVSTSNDGTTFAPFNSGFTYTLTGFNGAAGVLTTPTPFGAADAPDFGASTAGEYGVAVISGTEWIYRCTASGDPGTWQRATAWT